MSELIGQVGAYIIVASVVMPSFIALIGWAILRLQKKYISE